jgi:prepilin-type N-terminal cleavage/methylation domain-containing protein
MVRWARRAILRSNGFSLIELSIVMVVMGLLISVAFKMMPGTTERMRLDATKTGIIAPANEAIIGFMAANNRLPCPAAAGSGTEDCGRSEGDFPFTTVGLSGPLLDSSKVPIRYGVYRNAKVDLTLDADLAAELDVTPLPALPPLPNRYEPVLGATLELGTTAATQIVIGTMTGYTSDGNGNWATVTGGPTTSYVISRLDICHALQKAAGSGDDTYVHTIEGSNTPNPAYILASGGIEDADGDGALSSFDGLNDDTSIPVQFDSPERRRTADYDDIVIAQSFGDIAAMLGCPANKAAMNALAVASVLAVNIAEGQYLNNEGAIVSVRQAHLGVLMADVAILITAANVALATANMVIAIAAAVNSAGVSALQVLAAVIAAGLAVAQVVLTAAQREAAVVSRTGAVSSQSDAATALSVAITEAQNALSIAVTGDAQGDIL